MGSAKRSSGSELFNCAETTLESFLCKSCDFKTDFVVLLKQHLKLIHPAKLGLHKKPDSQQIQKTKRNIVKNYLCRNCLGRYTFSQLFQHAENKSEDSSDKKTNSSDAEETHKCINCNTELVTNNPVQGYYLKSYGCRNCIYKTYSPLQWLKHALMCVKFKTKKSSSLHNGPTRNKPKSTQIKTTKKPALRKNSKPKEIRWFHCDKCTFKTKKSFCLKRHEDSKHADERDIIWLDCGDCPYKAKRKSHLKRHYFAKHATCSTTFRSDFGDIQWYQCDQCPYQTLVQEHLKRHTDRSHGDKRRLKCAHCLFETNSEQNLQKHAGYYHPRDEDKRGYQCLHCNYRTLERSNLRRHTNTNHKDEKDIKWFECSQCSYKTKFNNNLKNHINAKHRSAETVLFKCEQCPFTTAWKATLKSHAKNKH